VRFFELRKNQFLVPKNIRFRFDRCIIKFCLEIFRIIDRIQKVIKREFLLLPKSIAFLIKFVVSQTTSTFQKLHKYFSKNNN